jgi:hypothetical protein
MPPGIAPVPWIFLPAVALMTLLAVLAHQDALLGQLRELLRDADDVAHRRVGVEAEEQVGRAQVEEVQRMRLEELAVVHQPAHLQRRRREFLSADDDGPSPSPRRGGGSPGRCRTAAGPRPASPKRAPLDEALEASELHDVQAGLCTWPASSIWIVTLPCPSTRVTGSITTFFMVVHHPPQSYFSSW